MILVFIYEFDPNCDGRIDKVEQRCPKIRHSNREEADTFMEVFHGR